ncbi:hypothetical protein E2C01_065795 [Portunus trituberculatus]|uniref:Uncharacterized protein n=1 Tax=Portunus trituberculatus TaxID=210409 RepID=A0A5B7HS58_PORTR|nr:hypothetical protein [Portunus trituberculatus]
MGDTGAPARGRSPRALWSRTCTRWHNSSGTRCSHAALPCMPSASCCGTPRSPSPARFPFFPRSFGPSRSCTATSSLLCRPHPGAGRRPRVLQYGTPASQETRPLWEQWPPRGRQTRWKLCGGAMNVLASPRAGTGSR